MHHSVRILVEPFTYEELKTNVVYRGSEAVREFFGLNYEDVDHIIFDSNYAFEDRIKDEIIHHINQVIYLSLHIKDLN